jgi:SWI/SNF-related matrix-associated actin-dependent regulator 1 of chromatin subfamily A
MFTKPLPTQLSGALFLAERQYALLADEPRVGKTGTAIIAADYILAETILVITTASGRPVWKRGFEQWAKISRTLQVLQSAIPMTAQVVIVGWPSLSNGRLLGQLLSRSWDLIISDEDHFAKNFEAKRTQALYGELLQGGQYLQNVRALYARASALWALSGTPLPHSPADTYPRLRALCPERLKADPARGWTDVTVQEEFLKRYTKRKPKRLSNWNTVMVVIGGQNETELRDRMEGFILRRTQVDVGIRAPIHDIMPLLVDAGERKEADGRKGAAAIDDGRREAILEAAEKGETKSLEMHLGPLRRITGEIKARAVVQAVKDELESGLDRIVLAYWHKSVGQILIDGLSEYGVTGIDGSTPTSHRQANVDLFSSGKARVFLGQIEAAGEAIDLSAAAELWFVEAAFSPKSMKQMSLRITNHTQRRQAVVKVCTLEGSIDEALQASLMRLWTSIREVLS